MTDHALFLAAIIARPDLDLPRLVYADWLEETAGRVPCNACDGDARHRMMIRSIRMVNTEPGTCTACHGTGSFSNGHAERAAFIRCQIRIAELTDERSREGCKCPRCVERDALRHRERELWPRLDGCGTAWFCFGNWLGNIGQFKEVGHVYYPVNIGLGIEAWVRRGFIETLEIPWAKFSRNSADILSRAPLRKVRLTDGIYSAMGWLDFTPVSGKDRVWTHPDYPGIEFELQTDAERIRDAPDGALVPVEAIP